MFDEKNKLTKECFGMAQFNKIYYGNARSMPVLFGADVQTNSLIELTITKNATVYDDSLMGRRYVPSHKKNNEVIKVHMTHAQFADLITSMNYGEGIPVTIHSINGDELSTIDKDEVINVIDAERESVKDFCEKVASDTKEALDNIQALMKKNSLNKADREYITNQFAKLQQNLEDNIPFYIRKAGEAIENLTERAKVELNATVQSSLIHAGCAALGITSPMHKLIENSDENQ